MSYSDKKTKIKRIQNDFLFSQNNRVTYVYLRSLKDNAIVEIVTASYDILINEKWHTVIRYDSHHGYLHRHERLTLKDERSLIKRIELPGTHSDWLTWAIQDLLKNFEEYKQSFFDNNSIIDNG